MCFKETTRSRVTTGGVLAFLLALASAAMAGDDKDAIPDAYRGTWLFRLYSDDAGKTYKAGDNKPLCVVSARKVEFVRNVGFSERELAVKSVTAGEEGGRTIHTVRFGGGKVWKLSENGGSLTALIHDGDSGNLNETYRITARKQAK